METQPWSRVPPRAARSFSEMVVTHHELATQSGLEVLGRGGTAVDAAVAANAVMGVVLPTACGLGGDLFALIHRPGDPAPQALNSSGRAGSGADPDRLRGEGHRAVPLRGPEAVTVPGCVDGWGALVGRFGALSLPAVLGPAIELAREGFPASAELSASLSRVRDLVADQPSAAPLYPQGRPPSPGERIRRPNLAATLEETAQGGRAAFYEGAVGRAIVEATGGRITSDDLLRPSAEWVEPIGLEVFGSTAWTVPPNSQGYLAPAAAWLAEQLEPPLALDDPLYTHLLVEALRAVVWERDDLVADPDHAPLPAGELLDPERLRPRLGRIDPHRRTDWPSPAVVGGGTTYLCAVDRSGWAVSLIQSNFSGIGSGLSAGDTGVFLQNRGAGFTLDPGHPNEMAPGKRPLHTLSPTLWTADGRTVALLGTRGGYDQLALVLQAAAHLLYLGLSPAEAQAAPRWVLQGDTVVMEARMPEAVGSGLARRGHPVERTGPYRPGWGPVSIVTVGSDGLRTGAADPRVESASAAGR